MVAQKIMFYTKDNRIVVADVDLSAYDDTRKRLELNRIQHYFAQYSSADISDNYNKRASKSDSEKALLSLMDKANTDYVNRYVHGFPYAKNPAEYKNRVKPNNFPTNVKKQHTLHFDYSVSDSDVPEFIKNLGFHILPNEQLVKIDIDDPDFDDKRNKQKTIMDVITGSRLVRIFRYHYKFPPADYIRLQKLITQYKSLSPKPDITEWKNQLKDKRDKKLFAIYAAEITYIEDEEANFLYHEFHHVKNKLIFDGIYCKPDAKRLTAENAYRLAMENERSAYLAQTVKAVNAYLKGGDLHDYSMFDNFSNNLAIKLVTMSDSQKVAYLSDLKNVVNYALEEFETKKRKFYNETQFADRTAANGTIIKGMVSQYMTAQPLDVPEDTSGEQYRLMRSAFYSMSVYNPTTGKTEVRSLAQYILPKNEIRITAEEMKDIVKPAKDKLKDKLKKFSDDSRESGINPDLLDEARAFYRNHMRSPRVIYDAETINVADLIDDKSLSAGESAVAPATSAPAISPVPSDKAYWSDDLQKYWSKFDDYKEKAKNNAEYSFSIKEQEMCYTSKTSVLFSDSCNYEMYDRFVKEPSNAGKPIRFAETLSKEQALMLYVACINNGRRVRGAIPKDLSAIDSMTSVPQAERDKFKAKNTPPAAKPNAAPHLLLPSPSIGR